MNIQVNTKLQNLTERKTDFVLLNTTIVCQFVTFFQPNIYF